MQIVKMKQFLDKYKELEKAIRDNMPEASSSTDAGCVVIYEEKLRKSDSLSAEKIKYIRIMRNIVTHNPSLDKFICVTDEHIKFLSEHVDKVKSINGTVKDKYLTIAKGYVLSPKDTVKTACEKFCKSGFDILVMYDVDKNIMKYVVEHHIISFIVSGGKMTTQIGKLDNLISFSEPLINGVSVNDPLTSVSKDLTFPLPVFRSGKFVGILR